MRILLVNPYYPISETPSPPLGLAYLAGALEEAGHEVRVLDLVVNPYDLGMLEGLLSEFRPAMAGVTSVTMTFDRAAQVVRDLKSLDPGLVTVMGGPHITFRARPEMEALPELDLAVLGEGEEAMVELARRLEAGGDWSQVRGVYYRRGSEIIAAESRKARVDLNSLPLPARRLLPLGRYRALGMPISMTTSRGCPGRCIFCVGRKMVGARVRYRRPGLAVDELAYLAGLGFGQVNIADDLFTANRRHCLGVCDEIIRRGLRVKWTSFARVDTVVPEVLRRMREAGCQAVSFGVETADPDILKAVKKGITLDQAVRAVEMCVDAGVTPMLSFILGLPGETPATVERTAAFAKRMQDMGAAYGFHLLAPFPGTEIRRRSREYGLRILTNDWSQYHANRAIVETDQAGRELLDQTASAWEKDFVDWLGDVKERMGRGLAGRDEIAQLKGLERTVALHALMMSRALEKCGPLNGDGARRGLAALARRVGPDAARPPEQVLDALEHAWGMGVLVRRRRGGELRWEWNDYPEG